MNNIDYIYQSTEIAKLQSWYLFIQNGITTNYQNLANRLMKDIYPFQDNAKWEQKNTCWLRDAYLNIVNQLALSCLKLFLRVILRRCAAEIMGNGIRWEWQIGKCMFSVPCKWKCIGLDVDLPNF